MVLGGSYFQSPYFSVFLCSRCWDDPMPLSQDYGAFVDIGLGRTDALMPNSMMGDKVGRRGLTQ